MQYTWKYESPLGGIVLAADEAGLTGLWFEGQKYFALSLDPENEERELPVFKRAREWLAIYFSGREPDFKLPLHFIGSLFQTAVWEILCQIPYGQTTSYGELAKRLARQRAASGKEAAGMSAQAVGGAVARNNISIIVPCHRVVGGNGSLTGYAGGLDRKIALLKLEGGYQDMFFIPKRSTAP